MAYDVAVRQFLQDKGVANNDIGYDQNSGNVTVKGQNFYKPELNMAGTTYSNRQNLDNAYGNYTKQQQPQNTAAAVGTGQGGSSGNNGASTSGTGTNPYTNPYTQMIGDLIKHLSDTSNAPQQDIYSTPQYAAAQAQQQRAAQQGIRSAQESLGSSGFGRSTALGESANRVQNDANEYLQLQLVPQIQAQLQQQRQQELQNQQNQLNNYFNLSNQADSQHNADRNFDAGRQDAATNATGYYNPSGMNADQINQEIAKNSASYSSANPEVQQQLHARNIYLNGLIGKTDSTGNGDYVGGNPNGNVGQRTVQGQQLDNQVSEVAYNHARDSLLDKRYEAKFNQDIKQQGFENALKIAVQQHQISNDNAQLAISQMNAKTSAANAASSSSNANFNKLMDVFKATGKAPSGLESYGIQPGASLADVKDNTQIKSEVDGLYTGLSSGKINAGSAIDEINQKMKIGLYTPAEGAQLLAVAQQFSLGNKSSMPQLSDTQAQQIEKSGGKNYQAMNAAQIEKEWNADPSGKAAGTALYDWSAWVRDPRGKLAGVSYPAYQQAFGASIS